MSSVGLSGWCGRIRLAMRAHSDPIAEGVLVVAVGSATRLIDYVQQMPKRYWATFLLGRRSPSDDTEIVAEELVDPPIPSVADLELRGDGAGRRNSAAAAGFFGRESRRAERLSLRGPGEPSISRRGRSRCTNCALPNMNIRASCSTFAAARARMFVRWDAIWRNPWAPRPLCPRSCERRSGRSALQDAANPAHDHQRKPRQRAASSIASSAVAAGRAADR